MMVADAVCWVFAAKDVACQHLTYYYKNGIEYYRDGSLDGLTLGKSGIGFRVGQIFGGTETGCLILVLDCAIESFEGQLG